jgi:hypothetical protein
MLALLNWSVTPASSQVAPEFSKSARCAVAAFVNGEATMQFVGLMVIANERRTIEVDSNAIETIIEESVASALRPMFGERVSPLNFASRPAVRDALTSGLGKGEGGPDRADGRDGAWSEVRSQAKAQGFDCLIVVFPDVAVSEIHPRKVQGLGFFVRGQGFTHYAGRYKIISIPTDKEIAAGPLLQEPHENFFTRKTPRMIWIGPVALTEFIKDFRTDARLNDRTVEVFKRQIPEIAPAIAMNIVSALTETPTR